MNKWLYRAVGAVGVASGALLLSNGVAHAQAANDARPDLDQQAMRGLVAEFFTPMGQHREEFIGGLLGNGSPLGGLTGGGGAGGLLGGLTGGLAGGSQGSGLLSGLTGSQGPVGSLTSGLTGGLTSGITGPDGSPLASLTGLTSGLTGLGDGGSPLAGLTNGGAGGPLGSLTGANGPLGGLTGGQGLSGLTGSLTGKGDGGPLAGLTGGQGLSGLTGSLTGNGPDASSPLSGLTSSLTGGLTGSEDGGPLSGITRDLTGSGDGGPLSGTTGSLTADAQGPLNQLYGGGPDRFDNLADPAGTGQRNPLDSSALRGIIGETDGIASAGPASTDIVSPSLRGTALDTTAQRPIQLSPDVARQVNDVTTPMVQALIADAVAKRMGITMGAHEEFTTDPRVEDLPILGDLPGFSSLLGPEGPLADMLVVGNFANGIPVVGDVLNGKLDPGSVTKLPVVRQVLDRGLLSNGSSASLPIVGSIPFIGDALSSIGKKTMGATDGIWQQNPLGDLLGGAGSDRPGNNNGVNRAAPTAASTAAQVGARGPVAGSPAGTSPSGAMPNGAMPNGWMPSGATPAGAQPAGARPLSPQAAPLPRPADTETPIHVGRHRATDRPEVADPELEAAPNPGSLPLLGSLTGVAGSAMNRGVGTLPLSTLVRNMPLVNDVPVVGELRTPLMVLKALPLVGTITGLVPVESDTAA